MENPEVRRAIDAYKSGQRDQAVTMVKEMFTNGAALGDSWGQVAQMALSMGEINLALKASKRFARIDRNDLMRQLTHAALLAEAGQVRAARSVMAPFEKKQGQNPALQNFMGTVKSLAGETDAALAHFGRVLAAWPKAGQCWFAMSALKTFTADDPDLLKMENLKGQFGGIEPQVHGAFLYALGKARGDAGDTHGAFEAYQQGAQILGRIRPFDQDYDDQFCNALEQDFTAERLNSLPPSVCESARPIFVMGLARSGTTLVEQILVSHSKVKDGGELNLFRQAVRSLGGYSFDHARSFAEGRDPGTDPWEGVANTYLHLLEERFGKGGHIVDKTLNHSRFLGLITHILPQAKIVWVRRTPEDTAWSCYKTYFTSGLNWTFSLDGIARYFKAEDVLFAHWRAQLGDRVHVVQYEDLVQSPQTVIPDLLAHCGLPDEPRTRRFFETRRTVMTASLAQVRQPLTTRSIGGWQAFAEQLRPFTDEYTS